jgi:2-desacetyl-2-hydroxyethyl bacteriochlorophyllide A dehydrogenase
MKTKAVLFTGVEAVAIETVDIPEPGPGEVLIENAYSCISPGTEMRCLAGKQPNAAAWPFVPGYSAAGRVIARGEGVVLEVGTPVFHRGTALTGVNRMWGGHSGHAVVAEAGVFPLPEGVDLLDASMTKLAAIAYHGLRHSNPLPHERVALVGLGPIGQLSARLHTLTGARVVAADLSAERVELARGAGVEAVQPTEGVAAAFRAVFPEGADVVVDATGAPSVLREAISLARDVPWGDENLSTRPRLLVQGSYPADFAVPYQEAFVKEIAFLLPRDEQAVDARAIIDLLGRGLLKVRDLFSEVCPPDEAPTIYASLRVGKLMTAAFRWH